VFDVKVMAKTTADAMATTPRAIRFLRRRTLTINY
jgi:hypothetical protein